MTDYTKLVKALRYCAASDECGEDCPWWVEAEDYCYIGKLTTDAADAIEDLQADNSELESFARMLTEQRDYWKDKAEKHEQKRGEWELIDGAEPMRWGCSRCKYLSWDTPNYCPRCGAKMEVQE